MSEKLNEDEILAAGHDPFVGGREHAPEICEVPGISETDQP